MQSELAEIIDGFSPGQGVHPTKIPGMNCIKLTEINARLPTVYTPSLCVIVQGVKRVMLEQEIYTYKPSEYLVVSVDLPVIGEVTEGSEERPYLCLQLDIDPHLLAEIMVQVPPMKEKTFSKRGIFVGEMDDALSQCVLRLARLLDTPRDIPILAPMIKREIYYRLLQGKYGDVIAQLAQTGSHMHRISLAIQQLREHYHQPIKVEELANQVGMSVSSFHSHFKAVTAMSPLQFQKSIRLIEARNRMIATRMDAASTAYEVGYESASQFSREYARMFGNPPGRDIKTLGAHRVA